MVGLTPFIYIYKYGYKASIGGACKTEKNVNNTLITFVLDRSGSMLSVLPATIEAFNAYLGSLAAADGESLFNLVQFDTRGIDKVVFEKPVKDVPLLSTENYVPYGGTPLIDAVVTTIRALEKSVDKKKAAGQDVKVVVCVQTDGQENASKENTWSDLKALIEEKQSQGWQFNFMGAGIDAYDQGSKMGISVGQTMSYESSDLAATRAAFSATAMNTMAFASGLASTTSYDTFQKAAAGDKFTKDSKKPAVTSKKPDWYTTLDLSEEKEKKDAGLTL